MFFELAAQQLLSPLGVEVPLEATDPIDEQDAVEVVDLVLEAHRLEFRCVDLQVLSLQVRRAQFDVRSALDIGLEIRDGQASLRPDDLSTALDDLRIDEHQRVLLRVVRGPLGVDDDEANRLSHLRGGKSDARLVVHHRQQVAREFANLVRDLLDRVRDLLQTFIGKFENLAQCHASVRLEWGLE